MKYALLAAALCTFHGASALACSARPCEAPALRLFPSGQVPANELYFALQGDDPGRLALRDVATGAPIPASIRVLGSARVFAPDEPLTPGQEVELRTDAACEIERTRRYTVAPPTTRDGSAPRLQVVAQGVRETEGDPSHPYSFVALTYASPGLPGAQTDVAIDVDGTPYTQLLGGDVAQTFTLMAYCDGTFAGDSCGGTGSWSVGKHVVHVVTTVVGQAPTTQRLEIELDCDEGGRVVRGELVANPELRSEGVDDEGCQLGARSGGGAWGLLALWRRRRRQGTSSPSAASTSARV